MLYDLVDILRTKLGPKERLPELEICLFISNKLFLPGSLTLNLKKPGKLTMKTRKRNVSTRSDFTVSNENTSI